MTDTVTIWHNPRCSKSRQTLALLEEKGVAPEVRFYLEDGPSAEEIQAVLGKLGLNARALMRRGEEEYKSRNLNAVEDEASLIAAMVEVPKLIERPVVIKGEKAAIGRPPEQVLDIL